MFFCLEIGSSTFLMKILAFDAASLEPIPLPSFFTPALRSNGAIVCKTAVRLGGGISGLFSLEHAPVTSWDALIASSVSCAPRSRPWPCRLVKALQDGILLIEEENRRLSITSCTLGRNGENGPLPQPCLGVEAGENCLVWWSPKELVVLAFKEPARIRKEEIVAAEIVAAASNADVDAAAAAAAASLPAPEAVVVSEVIASADVERKEEKVSQSFHGLYVLKNF